MCGVDETDEQTCPTCGRKSIRMTYNGVLYDACLRCHDHWPVDPLDDPVVRFFAAIAEYNGSEVTIEH